MRPKNCTNASPPLIIPHAVIIASIGVITPEIKSIIAAPIPCFSFVSLRDDDPPLIPATSHTSSNTSVT